MSRKARLAVFRDRLELISECPHDILNKFEPSEGDFALIDAADKGDVNALRVLSRKLYAIYGNDPEPNGALFRYLRLGTLERDEACAALTVRFIARYGEGLDVLDPALDVLDFHTYDELGEVIRLAKLKKIVAFADRTANVKDSLDELDLLGFDYSDHVRLYLMAKSGGDVGELAKRLGMPMAFGGTAVSDGEEEALLHALGVLDIDEWRDFWLRLIYEYANMHRGGELSAFAEEMIGAIEARAQYHKKTLHLYALKKYLSLRGIAYGEDECSELARACSFLGTEPDGTELDELIREGVYTDSRAVRVSAMERDVLGTEILHERNRYTLTMTLTNHQKRAFRHQWDSIISIETDSDIPPVINTLDIRQRRAEISRNGITLPKEKKAAQILCSGEIRFGERAYPFEADMILDISYVSTTKCTHCTVKPERFKRIGKYIVMQSIITVY